MIGGSIEIPAQDMSLIERLETLHKEGLQAFQISVSNKATFTLGTPMSEEQAKAIKAFCQRTGSYLVVHSKYVLNMARKDCGHQIDVLAHELSQSARIDADLVLHMGKNLEGLSRLEAIDTYVANISKALAQTASSNRILLETSAHQGQEFGYSLRELAYIFHQFSEEDQTRIGLCLDLCHVFVAGELEVRKAEAVEAYFEEFAELIGLEHLRCIHYNDSAVPFDSHNDHHADIGLGYIGNPSLGGSVDGFRVVAERANKHNIPIIFETPCTYKECDLLQQAKIVRGWALGNNEPYEAFIKANPSLAQIASMDLSSGKKRQHCEHHEPPPSSSPSLPKITIKAKAITKPKITIKAKA